MTEELDIPEKINITPFDAADFISDEDDEVEFLNAAFELDAPELVGQALRDIVRARLLRQPAAGNAADLQSFVRALGDGASVELGAVFRILSALGIGLVAVRADQAAEG